MLGYEEFLLKYQPKMAELLPRCLPDEKKTLVEAYVQITKEKRDQGVIRLGHQAFDRLKNQIDVSFGAWPYFSQIHRWLDTNVDHNRGLPLIFGNRECGRSYYQAVRKPWGEPEIAEARKFLDGFLYSETCDSCGGQIFPGSEEELLLEGSVPLFHHHACAPPAERL